MNKQMGVTVTPEIAKKWLATSKGNRALRASHINQLAYAMKSGEFKYNGDVIRFSSDGSLYDGHHRLNAIVKSGCTVLMDTVVITDDAKVTIDSGAKRSVADNIVFEYGLSEKVARYVSPMLTLMIAHDFTMVEKWITLSSINTCHAKYNSIEFRFKYFNENRDDILDSVDFIMSVFKQNGRNITPISESKYAAVVCLASRVYDRNDVKHVIRQIITGKAVADDSRVDFCRKYLIQAKAKLIKVDSVSAVFTVIKTLKAVMAGRDVCNQNRVPFSFAREGGKGITDFRSK